MKERQIEKLCRLLLGEIMGEPVPVPGGLLHSMYRVETKQGRYAVKALNPEIMRRPTDFSALNIDEPIPDPRQPTD